MKMHGNTIDRTGRVYGRWTVISRDWSRTSRVYWLCRCTCGRERSVLAGSLGRLSNSCGGCTDVRGNIRSYRVWSSMRSRCLNPAHRAFRHYGGRGIAICERWSDYKTFVADMGECPPGMSLDRINNDGPYSPENCRWATWIEQSNNKRTNRYVTLEGRTQTLKQWAVERGLNYATVKSRLNISHWSVEEALQS